MTDFLGEVHEIEKWLEEKFGLINPTPTANNTAVETALSFPPVAQTSPVPVITDPAPVITAPAVIKPKISLIHNTWPTQRTVWSTMHNDGSEAWASQHLTEVACPWTLHMDKVTLHSIRINKIAADSLKRVLQYIWEEAGMTQEAIEKLHYDRYSGSYNYRPIRGGTALSMHSYGLAIDFDDQENQQHSQHHLFKEDSLIVKAFKGEGWVWGGNWSPASIDAMHFQAARV